MLSMIDDLETDISMYDKNIAVRKSRLAMIDSLVRLVRSANLGGKPNEAYYYARTISPPANFFAADGTIQQLKSAGNLRLVRNREIANQIMAYDQEVRQAFFEMGDEVQIRSEYRQLASKLFNTGTFFEMQSGDSIVMPSNAPNLFSNDPMLINEFIGSTQYLRKVHTTQLARSEELKLAAKELIKKIREAYHLE